METPLHSVRLDREKCMGCTNCIKRCPTEAIRVRDGKARIMDERCIDCGECIRVCPHFAKYAVTDKIESINQYPYRIALPAPSLYGQFKAAQSVESVLAALRTIGFDSVFDVARAADIVSAASRAYIRRPDVPKPVISSACPAILRLLRVLFPNLLDHVLPFNAPIEVAARIAREEFCAQRGVAPEDVGVFFITPCPAKMTAIHSPMGIEKSGVDGCLSMIDVYGLLTPHIKKQLQEGENLAATDSGIGWAVAGGEALALGTDSYLAVDGVQNVIQVLEEIENERFPDLVFFEGLACTGGCVGGALAFENKYVAKDRIRRLAEQNRGKADWLKAAQQYAEDEELLRFNAPVLPVASLRLDDDLVVAMRKMEQLERINEDLPGLDCGSCGSPTCRALAEDVVRGYRTEMDCIFKLRDKLKVLAAELVQLASRGDDESKE
jgi:iron only hydrogenase large subunit-like protein